MRRNIVTSHKLQSHDDVTRFPPNVLLSRVPQGLPLPPLLIAIFLSYPLPSSLCPFPVGTNHGHHPCLVLNTFTNFLQILSLLVARARFSRNNLLRYILLHGLILLNARVIYIVAKNFIIVRFL